MASTKAFQLIASKLAINNNDKVLSKAAEYERLLQSKSVAGSNLTETAKVVICLDLAADYYGVDLDSKMAAKYSGLKGPSYSASRKMVENLVEHNTDKLVIPSLCLTLQCTTVQGLAEKILQEYQNQAKTALDLNLPQYVCMAVFHACRLNKVKVSKSKLIAKSRLKPSQWAKMAAEWTSFVDEKFAATSVKKRGRPKKENVAVEVPENEDNKMEVDECNKGEDDVTQTEPYEEWRARMLDQAYREFKELQTKSKNRKDSVSPVKSVKKDLFYPVKSVKMDLNSPVQSVKLDFNSPNKCIKLDFNTKSGKKDLFSPRKVLNKNEGSSSPRRSPRKTPQKFSPYKDSPKKTQGVRLLFPL